MHLNLSTCVCPSHVRIATEKLQKSKAALAMLQPNKFASHLCGDVQTPTYPHTVPGIFCRLKRPAFEGPFDELPNLGIFFLFFSLF